jgi:hypothetical protein
MMFGATTKFKEIEAPHAIVHERVLANVAFIEKEDRVVENKEQIVENFTTMEKASFDLFVVLDDMLEESVSHN